MIRLHIGHHFYGAGNVGDDLMLAGFLGEAARHFGSDGLAITCAIPFDLDSQRRRFPQVQWLAYGDTDAREAAVAACDAWLGLGDSPFQHDQGTWFLDHLAAELAACQRHGKPMYCLGVGVESPRDVDHPTSIALIRAAGAIWTRDAHSAEHFARAGARRVVAGADLSHAYLADLPLPPVEAGVTGFVLNFENPRQFEHSALVELFGSVAPPVRWMVQEVRELPGSETETFNRMSPRDQARLDVRVPAYATAGSVPELLSAWGTPERLVTSRYHAAIVGCWAGARVVAIERSAKLRGIIEPAGCVWLPSLTSAEPALRALAVAEAVPRARMHSLAELSRRCCAEFFQECAASSARRARN
jgi:polysaccharide pyruvyl transferase WcaK-like protein